MSKHPIQLTKTEIEDLHAFFEFQLDKEARYMAAFIAKDGDNKTAYIERHSKYLADPSITTRTIRVNDEIAGSISKFIIEQEAEITYWIDRNYWNRGIAGEALRQFLNIENTRPLFARTAFDNYGSQHVLEKCGFVKTGTDKGFANARQAEIEEYIYKLG